MVQQAFSQQGALKSTTISSVAFSNLMKKFRPDLLSPYVKENLVTVGIIVGLLGDCLSEFCLLCQIAGCSSNHSRSVGYPYFRAFNGMLNNLDLFKQVVKNGMGKSKTELTKGEDITAGVD